MALFRLLEVACWCDSPGCNDRLVVQGISLVDALVKARIAGWQVDARGASTVNGFGFARCPVHSTKRKAKARPPSRGGLAILLPTLHPTRTSA